MQQKTTMYSFAMVAMLALAMSSTAVAQKKGKPAPTPAPAPAATPAPAGPVAKDDKVDISDLENKYWAPKDTDFSVVQNRTYSKDGRFLITPQWGKPINDAYSEGTVLGGTVNYFWSERFGVQATYLSADLEHNDSTVDLINFGTGVQPDHGKLSSYYGVGFNLVPFYAKMSFWGTRIIYFDMAFTPTVGMTTYDQQMQSGNKEKSALTLGLDVTQYFFFNKWFAIRADLKNQFYQQEVVKYHNTFPMVEGQKVKDKWIQDTMFLLGATFYF